MMLQAEPVPRPDWFVLPRPGCRGVECKVLLHEPSLALALLKFGPRSTIDEHAASFPVDVICLEGAGHFSVAGQPARIHAGERIRWPPHQPHCLWTDESPLLTLMVERLDQVSSPT